MENFEIFIGAHSATAIIFFLANDVDFFYIKRVRGADDGADVKIVFNVFDGDLEGSTGLVQFRFNLLV